MRLLDHTFFKTLENEQKFDVLDFENLLLTIKNIPKPANQASFEKLVVQLMDCQRAIYLSLLFHFDPEDLSEIKNLPVSAGEIIWKFDEAMDEVLENILENE